MAINNQYSQTPKRVYSNKPFVNGMNYTNSDLQPYVCRAVANLEMESSNTATKIRQGVINKAVAYNDGDYESVIVRYYNKLISFKYTITPEMYSNNVLPTIDNPGLGISVVTDSSKAKSKLFDKVINSSSQLNYSDRLEVKDSENLPDIDEVTVITLQDDEGNVPHTINSADYSFAFFGILVNRTDMSIIYKGIIKLYNHVASNKIIIEYIKPHITDVVDIQNYGTNLIADNPLLYRDYVYIDSSHNYYSEYMGNSNSQAIALSTVQIYDSAVDNPITPLTDTSAITANILKAFNRAHNGYIYVRPYYIIPKGNYSASVKLYKDTGNKSVDNSGSFSNEIKTYYYNFTTGKFVSDVTIDPDTTVETITTNNSYSLNNLNYKINMDLTTEDLEPMLYILGSARDTDSLSLNIKHTTLMSYAYHKMYKGSELNTIFSTNKYDVEDDEDEHDPQELYNHNVFIITYIEIPEQTINLGLLSEVKLTSINDPAVKSNLNYSVSTYMYITHGDENLGRPLEIININDNIVDAMHKTQPVELSLEYYFDNNLYIKPVFESKQVNIEINNDLILDDYIYLTEHFITEMHYKYTTSDAESYPIYSNSIYHNEYVDNANKYPQVLYTLIGKSSWDYDWGMMNTAYDDQYFVSTNRYVVDSKLDFNIELLVKNNATLITTDCIYDIQTDNEFNYSIPIIKSAFNDIDLDSLTLTVTVFKTEEQVGLYAYYFDTEAVSVTTAVIQTNAASDDKLYYNTTANEIKIMSRANKLGLHLGHYIVYGDTTGSNSLFYSDYNNYSYFPSNYKIDFDNPIVHIHQHLGNLVVFTTDDIYMLFNGNVPSTTVEDGSEVPFTQKLVQSNVRLGYENINTVRSIGKDVFFISSDNEGYLLKSNKYVNNDSDVYLIKITNQIADLLDSPYNYAKDRLACYGESVTPKKLETKYYFREDDLVEYNSSNTIKINAEFTCIHITYDDLQRLKVYDGDTFEFSETVNGIVKSTVFRLGSIDCPELDTDRLGATAGAYLSKLLKNTYTELYIFHNNDQDMYDRYISYIFVGNAIVYTSETDYHVISSPETLLFVNRQLLSMGLASLEFEDYTDGAFVTIDNDSRTLYSELVHASSFAKNNKLGIYNSLEYREPSYVKNGYDTTYTYDLSYFQINNNFIGYNYNVNSKYVYTTNSYINIVQSILLSATQGLTIIYKYNIDNKTWISYDIPFAIFPTDIVPDTSKTGYMVCCSNDYKSVRSIASELTFSNAFTDTTEVAYNITPAYNDTAITNQINVYFDSGNQSISLLYDKLFREIKISLGALPDDLLTANYSVNFYVDGIKTTVRPHYFGNQNEAEGFKKVTFLTPARGRIPRFTFSANCNSSINILEYALIYLQLNAK